MGALTCLWLPIRPYLPPQPPPASPNAIDSIRDITGAEKTIQKAAAFK